VVRPKCSKFVAAVQAIEDSQPTDATEPDMVNFAIILYNGGNPRDRNAQVGEFSRLKAWRVVKNVPKVLG
jgi:hypothetical protein